MFPLLRSDADNHLELFQIWLNLPARRKMVQPYFSMLWANTIPRLTAPGVEVAVFAGRLGELTPPPPPPDSWASADGSDVAIWTVKLQPGARWTLPAAPGTNRSLYFFEGSGLKVAGRAIPPRHQVDLHDGAGAQLEAGGGALELLLLQGRPIGEPVASYGPFVMNTEDEIRQAFADYRRTRFGGWPWPEPDPVHGREPVRFARRTDGKVERPT
jgi:redox-sensitive bicupin YhaK (pirin superfamily)